MQSSFVVYSCDESHRIDDSPRKEKRFREEYVAKEKKNFHGEYVANTSELQKKFRGEYVATRKKKISVANTWRIRRNRKKKFPWRIRRHENFRGAYIHTNIYKCPWRIRRIRSTLPQIAAHA